MKENKTKQGKRVILIHFGDSCVKMYSQSGFHVVRICKIGPQRRPSFNVILKEHKIQENNVS